MLSQPEHPRDQLPGVRVRRREHTVAIRTLLTHLAIATEMALDLPRDVTADPYLRRSNRISELPVDPVGIRARIEVGRALEVVLGLRRIADLPPHPREPENADRAPLVRSPDEVELAALVEQLVGIDATSPDVVALHRVVIEHDRLAPEDRGLDLR